MATALPFAGGDEICDACLQQKADRAVFPSFSSHVAASLLDRCESPIEKLLTLAILLEVTWLRSRGVKGIVVDSQREVPPYRADVALEFEGRRAIVECDGHDFHERTKDQAARDKRRDRAIQMGGYMVLHFTGSEIHADPEGCAHEALKAVGATIEQLVGTFSR